VNVQVLTDPLRKEILSAIARIARERRKAILIVIGVTALILAAIPIASWVNIATDYSFPSAGYIRTTGVKAYWDSVLQNETKKIQWGTLYIGSKNNVTVYLRSISNVNTTLAIETQNWTFFGSNNISIPEPTDRQSYMYLSWNYTNAIIQPNQVLPVTLTLVLEDNMTFIEFLIQNDIKAFNFDIRIYTN